MHDGEQRDVRLVDRFEGDEFRVRRDPKAVVWAMAREGEVSRGAAMKGRGGMPYIGPSPLARNSRRRRWSCQCRARRM